MQRGINQDHEREEKNMYKCSVTANICSSNREREREREREKCANVQLMK